MENKKVILTNTIKSRVVINVPEANLRRVWEKKGAKKSIDFKVLEEAIYDKSVEYLLKEGILYIEDMDVKIALGLEEEDATEPTIVMLTDEDMHRFLTAMPIFDFKQKVKTLSREQVQALVEYAIEEELTDYEKTEFLKALTEIDIIRAVQLRRDDKKE